MKIKKQTDKTVLSITKSEWVRMGQEAGWPVPGELESSEPLLDPFRVETKREGEQWAVYVNGALLCTTAQKEEAIAVASIIRDLWDRVQDAESRSST